VSNVEHEPLPEPHFTPPTVEYGPDNPDPTDIEALRAWVRRDEKRKEAEEIENLRRRLGVLGVPVPPKKETST
jgi:hypothetical protein